MPPRLLVILGPTGTGKTGLASAVAERLGGEIVGFDALQVYRRFDVGTAKPTPEERDRIPHHLVDYLDPAQDSTLVDHVVAAESVVAEIASRGRVPILVGGTGLYLRGMLRGVIDAPPRDERLRERLWGMERRYGAPRLHRWLRGVDPGSAERLPAGDAQRIVRALEMFLTTRRTWSERLRREGSWQGSVERYPNLKIGLDQTRESLRDRLDRRAERFFEAGLAEEVRSLLAEVPRTANAFKAIGYREVVARLEAGEDPATALEEVKRNTRRYAKRQRSWFRREPDVHWLDAREPLDRLVERVVSLWRGSSVEA